MVGVYFTWALLALKCRNPVCKLRTILTLIFFFASDLEWRVENSFTATTCGCAIGILQLECCYPTPFQFSLWKVCQGKHQLIPCHQRVGVLCTLFPRRKPKEKLTTQSKRVQKNCPKCVNLLFLWLHSHDQFGRFLLVWHSLFISCTREENEDQKRIWVEFWRYGIDKKAIARDARLNLAVTVL